MKDEQLKPTFFFDGTHGKLIPTVLKAVGLSIRLHRNQGWLEDMLDVDWIAECGKNDWAIISGDKQIARVPEERQAVIDGKCKVFMFEDGHETTTEDWAASLLVARHRLVEIVDTANGPFFVTIKRCRVHGHITLPDFVLDTGAGWKIKAEQPKSEATPELPTDSEKPVKREQQQVIDFNAAALAAEQSKESSAVDSDEEIMIDIETQQAREEKSPMNGERANKQLERIRAIVRESGSTCTIEVVPGDLDSVHLRFHCGEKRYSVPWVGAWLETLSPEDLWHELEIATQGAIEKPKT